ncbi:MAG: hypothetical protein KDC57_12785 [Saprospiraceae bacterium]|nr:hypothetical protein [Saprospiraceae bacterium]
MGIANTRTTRQTITIIFFAWLIWIGIDFLFHASLLQSFWNASIAAFKKPNELFSLIPYGYLSFLLLTVFLYLLVSKIREKNPTPNYLIYLAVISGLLLSGSNFFAQYSYLNIPPVTLLIFNAVYFIEIVVSVYVIGRGIEQYHLKQYGWRVFLAFILMIITGLIIQNIH